MFFRLFLSWMLPVLLHVIAGVLLLWFYYSDHAIRVEAIPIHALLVISVFCSVLCAGLLLSRLPFSAKITSSGIALLHILASVWLLLIHISTAVGFFFWADPASLSDLFDYIPLLPLLIEQTGTPRFVVYLLASLVMLAFIAAWYLWVKKLYSLFQLFASRAFSPGRVFMISGVFIFSVLLLLWYRYAIQNDYLLSLRGEPVADYFRTTPLHELRFKQTDTDPDWYRSHSEAAARFRGGLPYNTEPAHVILIMLDAARGDHMPMYGYERNTTPFLDSLYTVGALQKVNYAASTCSQSECGITTMFASAFYPRTHAVNYKLHEALHDAGYTTHFLLSGDHSRLYGFLKQFYGPKIDFYRDSFDAPGRHPSDDAVLPEFLAEVTDAQQNQPSFFFFHMMSSHIGGKKHEGFTPFQPADPPLQYDLMVRGIRQQIGDAELEIIRNNYDNGLYQADQFIREIFTSLEEKGYLDQAVVIITSDHGEGLGEAGIYGHAKDIHHTTINIPLLIYTNGKLSGSARPDTELKLGSLIDIPPLVFGRLGLPTPDSWEGKDLFREPRIISHHMSTHIRGNEAVIKVIGDRLYKYSRTRGKDDFRIYQLDTDPIYPVSADSLKDEALVRKLRDAWEKEFEKK